MKIAVFFLSSCLAHITLANPANEATIAARQETLAPSPTESVGCQPHGDHWHCEGPRATTPDAPTSTTEPDDDDDDDDDHGHESSTGALPPSPTASFGCQPHGDHWHCEGPITASATATAAVTSHHDDDDHGTGVLPPSPTASVGCQPHGDHWHCTGPATAGGASNGTTTTRPSTTIPTAGAAVQTVAQGMAAVALMVAAFAV